MNIAVVVQRWHPGVSGGAERHAFQWAELLSHLHNVTILTTTARDAVTWTADSLPEGEETVGRMKVLRFRVTIGRTAYWHHLHEDLLREFRRTTSNPFRDWSFTREEEWIRHQGPHSEDLLRHLAGQRLTYDAVIFFSYLYSPTYFGSLLVPRDRAFFVPTLHDEPAAYLPAFSALAGRFRRILWNTEEETALGRRLWGEFPGRTVGCPIEIPVPPLQPDPPDRASSGKKQGVYLLYSGRLDQGKGLPELFAFFQKARRDVPNVKLLLTGNKGMRLPLLGRLRGWVDYRGFVSEEEKGRLIDSAAAFVMPSPVESLSISTLEAMAHGTPVIVNGRNPVLRGHVERSGVGSAYTTQEEFLNAVRLAVAMSDDARLELKKAGRAYVDARYAPERIRAILNEELSSGS